MKEDVFSQIAETYDSQRIFFRSSEVPLFEILKAFRKLKLYRTGWGLDLGSGTGYWMERFKESWPDIEWIGVDCSYEMVSMMKKKGLNGLMGDILRLPFQSEVFSVVTASLVIHHFADRDKKKVIKKVYRLLKPGGWFFVWELFTQNRRIDALNKKIFEHLLIEKGASRALVRELNRRRKFDRLCRLDRFQKWMERAGFLGVGVFYRHLDAVFIGGQKARK